MLSCFLFIGRTEQSGSSQRFPLTLTHHRSTAASRIAINQDSTGEWISPGSLKREQMLPPKRSTLHTGHYPIFQCQNLSKDSEGENSCCMDPFTVQKMLADIYTLPCSCYLQDGCTFLNWHWGPQWETCELPHPLTTKLSFERPWKNLPLWSCFFW